MSSTGFSLQQIKKEIQHLGAAQLTDLCIRLSKYKKENKELLAYLLFEAHDENAFIEKAKAEADELFRQLPANTYHMAKALRKILRLNSKYTKFTGSKHTEIELLLHFGARYIQYADKRVAYKPLRFIFIRQIEKITALIQKLPEDLQADYQPAVSNLLAEANHQLTWFNKNNF